MSYRQTYLFLENLVQKTKLFKLKFVTYNLGQNIVNKFTRSGEIDFSMECFAANFSQISSTTTWFLSINSKHFKISLEIS